jgi:hypothetical protein
MDFKMHKIKCINLFPTLHLTFYYSIKNADITK